MLLLTHPACLRHDNGPHHPECPDRLRAVIRALEAQEFSSLVRAQAPEATREQLLRVHPERHVDRILSTRPAEGARVHLDADTSMNAHSAEAALRAAGAGVEAVDCVMSGEFPRAFCAVRPPGHHAEPDSPMGFCLFANAAIAARHAQAAHGVERVAVLDFDVHHGNGTQAAFLNEPSLMLASSHQSPLYPGTGEASETGVGNILNVPLAAGTDGATFLRVWERDILPAVQAFSPGLIIVSAGFDAHRIDPLAGLRLVEEDFARLTEAICDLANTVCSGRVVSMLEGGYDLGALARSAAAHTRALIRA
ncbi:histone deacetylase family protein [Muricoccus pecuniae]|uniref:Acetoin utilization deacetylase AcuC-like enzyme n=1 Tax=Muricoccus pecuniae TaxID=693023 RepID=A0A840Y4B4_9PROT|nr:histone deacetylase family protein [Roseomonas pecuniae]MBB5693619.1 acetoin utilization deacetylase AcuC-like enzyme [Roseomonas pecuniae]